ncbi:MAG: DUF2851 family protein, partial [Prevotella sp.]|nr:DUF2851 family protein [Prevotella sp.]
MIDEKFLSFIWEQRLLGILVYTADNVEVKILSAGYRNYGQGPDFSEAQLQIGNTLWYGSVEVHVKSSDWFVHCHHIDSNYSNVICHIVWKHDANVFHTCGDKIPVIEISKLIPPFLIENYKRLMVSMGYIPCSALLNDVPEHIKYSMLETAYFESLDKKLEKYLIYLKELNYNFDELCYRMIVRSFGFKINNEAFYETSKKLPFKYLLKYSTYHDVIDALLFGQANLLHNEFKDDYPKFLWKEYKYYANLHNLKPQKIVPWKLLRLRPANFPWIRLAQCATIFKNGFHGLDTILLIRNISDYYKMFCNPLNEYWNSHVRFDKLTTEHNRSMGNSSVDLILINTVIPFLF